MPSCWKVLLHAEEGAFLASVLSCLPVSMSFLRIYSVFGQERYCNQRAWRIWGSSCNRVDMDDRLGMIRWLLEFTGLFANNYPNDNVFLSRYRWAFDMYENKPSGFGMSDPFSVREVPEHSKLRLIDSNFTLTAIEKLTNNNFLVSSKSVHTISHTSGASSLLSASCRS
jgi:hypothetical protein